MYRKLLIISILLSFSTLSFAKEQHKINFDIGVKSFKEKNYKSAIKHFKKARSQGMKGSVLIFNIATTYYRLGSYKYSKENFKKLTRDKNFKQIAYYNLGLIAEKKKNKKSAISWYKKSVANNKDSNITQLADNKLDKLLNRKRKKSTSKTIRANVSLALGNDDNVTNEASDSPSNKSDNYRELIAYLKVPVAKNINVKGIMYDLAYGTETTSDYNFYSAAIDYRIKTGKWRLTPEIGITKNSLNKTDYQNSIDYKFSAKRKFDRSSSINIRYRYSDIDSQNTTYDYLQGDRHQLRVDYKNKIALGKLRFRYQLETNNRQNRTTPTAKNYSPTRHTFHARLKHKLNKKWRLSEEVSYRVSSYDSAAGISREDTRLRLRLIADMKLNKNWSTGVKYTHTDNDSNLASETYKRNNIQAFFNWSY